jgi:hypothetical protein
MIYVTSRRAQTIFSALVMASLLLIPAAVLANGTPVRVRMAYQPPLSNAGPTDATGTVEIAFDDGEVHGDIEGLGDDLDTQYELWLYDSKTEEILSLTKFQGDATGIAQFDALFDEPIPEEGWDLIVITIEDDPDSSPEPDARWSLVGAFSGEEVEAELVPAELPRTGERPAPSEDSPMIAAIILGGALAAGFVLAWAAPGRREEI